MTRRCKVCALAPERREAVDTALSAFLIGKISLLEVAERTGLHQSSLYRHSQRHLSGPSSIAPTLPILAPKVQVFQPTPTKEELLSRLENLWQEVVASILESKGSGDLQVRAGFLREARRTLEIEGDWTGHFPRQIVGNQPGALVQIVLPAPPEGSPPRPQLSRDQLPGKVADLPYR
jgi:hypothetical protein